MNAHGCFRFDYTPYHEQSEFLLTIYVIPRFAYKGRIFRPPKILFYRIRVKKKKILKFNLYYNVKKYVSEVLYLHKSLYRSHTNICFVENQLSRGKIGLSKIYLLLS